LTKLIELLNKIPTTIKANREDMEMFVTCEDVVANHEFAKTNLEAAKTNHEAKVGPKTEFFLIALIDILSCRKKQLKVWRSLKRKVFLCLLKISLIALNILSCLTNSLASLRKTSLKLLLLNPTLTLKSKNFLIALNIMSCRKKL
jgi:hypothetical protein